VKEKKKNPNSYTARLYWFGPVLIQSKCNKTVVLTRALATIRLILILPVHVDYLFALETRFTLRIGTETSSSASASAFAPPTHTQTPRAARAARLQDVVLKEEKALAKRPTSRLD
jgi:hypothetical protein